VIFLWDGLQRVVRHHPEELRVGHGFMTAGLPGSLLFLALLVSLAFHSPSCRGSYARKLALMRRPRGRGLLRQFLMLRLGEPKTR
jgi:hypothetical protein